MDKMYLINNKNFVRVSSQLQGFLTFNVWGCGEVKLSNEPTFYSQRH